jgi:hypothetical protein
MAHRSGDHVRRLAIIGTLLTALLAGLAIPGTPADAASREWRRSQR